MGNRHIATLADDETKCVPWKGHRYRAWRTEEEVFSSDGGGSGKASWERRSWCTSFTRTQRWSGAGIGSESNRRSVPSCTWGTLSLSRLPFVIPPIHPPPPPIIKTKLCSIPLVLEKSVSSTQLCYSSTPLRVIVSPIYLTVFCHVL